MHGTAGTVVGVVVFVVAAAVLTSPVGVVASPLTFAVLLVVVAAHPSVPFIVAGTLIGGVTSLEGGWGFGYVVFGQFSGWTAVTMILGLVGGASAMLALGLRARHQFLTSAFEPGMLSRA